MPDRSQYDRKRHSDKRLSAIIAAVASEPPRTVLDLGAWSGSISCGLAKKFGCKVTAIERYGPGEQHPKVNWISEEVRAKDLEAMGKFDLVVALSVLHHMADWAAAYWALRKIGKTVIIEATNPEEGRPSGEPERSRALHQLVTREGRVIHYEPAYGMAALPRPMVAISGCESPPGSPGRVMSGKGSVAPAMPKFLGLREAVGFQCYPGSFNVKAEDKSFGPTGPFKTCESRFGTYRFWPAYCNGVRGAVFHSPNGLNSGGFIEFVAPVRMRSALAVEDGDLVYMELSREVFTS